MSQSALKVKRARTKRRLDSAVAGGVFVSQRDLELRWGCNARTASVRIRELPQYRFSETSTRYKLSDVEAYERRALAKGFEQRAKQLRSVAVSDPEVGGSQAAPVNFAQLRPKKEHH